MTHTRQTLVFAGLSLLGGVALAAIPACRGVTSERAETTSQSVAQSPDLVIRQVYSGGGVAGATYSHDYVELFNRSHLAVSLGGKSLQYASSEGAFNTGSNILALPAVSLDPGQSFLIQLHGGGNGPALPAADLVAQGASQIVLDKKSGKLAIVNTSTPLTNCGFEGSPCSTEAWIDFVAWGDASQAEGAAVAELSSTTSAQRKAGGCTDSGNNAADFDVATPSPRDTTSPKTPCSAPDGGTDAGSDASVDAAVDAATDAPVKPDSGPEPMSILLNEVLFNPPSAADAPYEYAEIICSPSSSLWGYYFVAFEGDGDSQSGSPGVADVVIDLSGYQCGSNGLVLIKAAAGGHAASSKETTVVTSTMLDTGAGALENATTTFALVKSPNAPIVQGTDYDTTNSGALTLPLGASLVDGFSVFEQAAGVTDRTYAPRLELQGQVPGMASRISGATTSLSANAWFFGVLKGTEASSLTLDPAKSSASTPIGAVITPGGYNYEYKPPKQDGGSVEPEPEPEPEPAPAQGSATKRDPPSKAAPSKPTSGEITPPSEDTGCSTTHSSPSSFAPILGALLALAASKRKKR
jgi:hypothetical protein